MPYRVYLKKNEEKRILAGHPWVYANEAARIEGKDVNGSVAEVFSHDGRYVGKGLINHLSKILVRILTRGREEIDRDFFLNRIRAADKYRKNLGYSDCYRAVFAEADGLPAFIVDRYHDLLSVQFLSLGMDRRKELLCECALIWKTGRRRAIFSTRRRIALPCAATCGPAGRCWIASAIRAAFP